MTTPATAAPLRAPALLGPVNLLLLLAVADTFGGLFQAYFPATLLLRGALVVYFIAYVLSMARTHLATRLGWLVVLGFFVVKLLIDYLLQVDERVLSVEGGATLRLLYFPLLLAFLLDQRARGLLGHAAVGRALLAYGWLIIASLFIGELSGLGGTIGGRGADMDGGKGFMIGANEVGLMLILTAPFVGAHLVRRSGNLFLGGVVTLLLYGVAGVYVFTKSSLISALVAAFAVYRAFMARGSLARRGMWVALLAALLFAVRLVIDNLDAIEAFALGTFFSSLFNDGLIAFLFRGRQNYISAIFPQLLDHAHNAAIFLFGAGELFVRDISVRPLGLLAGEGTTFEMDFFDLFACYGAIGSALYLGLVAHLLHKAGPVKFPLEIKLALFAIFAHAFMAGHVLFSPQVTTLLALVLLYFHQPDTGAAARPVIGNVHVD
jgi:hypothetical protein